MKGVDFPLHGPGEAPVVFRFTIRAARDMEKAAGCNYQSLFAKTQYVDAVCLMVCYGLRHDDPKMTVEKAIELVETYIDKGGRIIDLYFALQKAMDKSGCYGNPPDEDEAPTSEDRPPSPAA